MPTEKEKLVDSNKKISIGLSIGAAVWFGSWFLIDSFPGSDFLSYFIIPLPVIWIAGFFCYLYYLIRLLRMERRMKQNPELAMTLNDEYTQHIRFKSLGITYWIIIVVIILLLVLEDIYSLSASIDLKIIFLAVILTPNIVFLIMDREN